VVPHNSSALCFYASWHRSSLRARCCSVSSSLSGVFPQVPVRPSQSNTPVQEVLRCNSPGARGPSHHYPSSPQVVRPLRWCGSHIDCVSIHKGCMGLQRLSSAAALLRLRSSGFTSFRPLRLLSAFARCCLPSAAAACAAVLQRMHSRCGAPAAVLQRLYSSGGAPAAALQRLCSSGSTCIACMWLQRLRSRYCAPAAALQQLCSSGCTPAAALQRLRSSGCAPAAPRASRACGFSGYAPATALQRWRSSSCATVAVLQRRRSSGCAPLLLILRSHYLHRLKGGHDGDLHNGDSPLLWPPPLGRRPPSREGTMVTRPRLWPPPLAARNPSCQQLRLSVRLKSSQCPSAWRHTSLVCTAAVACCSSTYVTYSTSQRGCPSAWRRISLVCTVVATCLLKFLQILHLFLHISPPSRTMYKHNHCGVHLLPSAE
jgi:hypothetical protein